MVPNERLFYLSLLASTLMSSSEGAATADQWKSLNETVNGRLNFGIPLAQSCYSTFNLTLLTDAVPNLAECTQVQQGYDTNAFISGNFGGFMNTNWGICQKNGQGCPLNFNLPSDPTIYAPGQVCYQGSIPPYYIDVREVADIQAALEFSKTTGVPLTIKNTGHDYKGRSSAPNTLALWTHNVQPTPQLVKGFIPDGCSQPVGDGVTFGAGQQFDGLYKFADDNGITVLGGASGTVGPAGGWITGGGHSAISNAFGLGVDNVLQIRTVLPNGTYVTANECQNQDLWFALRGGGGGTFGVNFEMTTRALPKVTLQVAYINFYSPDPNSSSEFISLLIQNATQWAKEGWGGYLLPGTVGKQISGFLMMTPLLNNSQAKASMKAVFDFANTSGNYIYSSGIDEYDSFYDMYSTFLAPSGEKVGLGTALGGRLIPASQFEGADNQAALLKALTTIQDMITWPTRSPDQSLLTYGAPFQILVTTPNNYPTTAENDTSALHPAWRDAVWSMVINTPFSNSASAADIQTAFQITTSATDILRKLNPASGAYLNEADTYEPDPVNTYWGSANYERLLKIKEEIDPGNILTCWDAIGWDPTDERYSCYPSL